MKFIRKNPKTAAVGIIAVICLGGFFGVVDVDTRDQFVRAVWEQFVTAPASDAIPE